MAAVLLGQGAATTSVVGEFVGRTFGFGHEHEFQAEVTVQTSDGGTRTVVETAATAAAALARAKYAAASVLHSRRPAAGFARDGWREFGSGATFKLGFAS